MKYMLLETGFGCMGLVSSATGLRHTFLPRSSKSEVLQLIATEFPGAMLDNSAFGDLPDQLRKYFSGEKIDFHCILDLADHTAFQQEVWKVTASIPYGETRSYSWVAERVGKRKAARAIGRAMATNPVPVIVPCHRVIGSDGGLRGFGGGLELKQRLLDLEAKR